MPMRSGGISLSGTQPRLRLGEPIFGFLKIRIDRERALIILDGGFRLIGCEMHEAAVSVSDGVAGVQSLRGCQRIQSLGPSLPLAVNLRDLRINVRGVFQS